MFVFSSLRKRYCSKYNLHLHILNFLVNFCQINFEKYVKIFKKLKRTTYFLSLSITYLFRKQYEYMYS
jgi:hypothetical protein